jgi:hypothetical protein
VTFPASVFTRKGVDENFSVISLERDECYPEILKWLNDD